MWGGREFLRGTWNELKFDVPDEQQGMECSSASVVPVGSCGMGSPRQGRADCVAPTARRLLGSMPPERRH